MKKIEKILLYAVSVAVIIMVGMKVSNSLSSPKIAFVDIGKMLEGYKFKQSLEKSSNQGLNQIKTVIDSLEMVRKVGAGGLQLDTQLARANYAFQQYYRQSSQEISKKVWERLNPVMEQYGKEKGLQILIGATGTGTVLYGSKKCDITDDLTKYVNTRFEKGN